MKIFLFILLSLQSYYFYSVNAPLFSLASFAMISMIVIAECQKNGFKIRARETKYILIFYLSLFLWSLLGLIYLGEVFDIKRLIGFLLVFLAALFAEHYFKNTTLTRVIKAYLIVHMIFFYMQILAYYLLGVQLDFLMPFTGEQQRMFSVSFSHPLFGHLIRPAGLYTEPGTYAAFIAPFVALFSQWKNDSRTNNNVFWAGLASLFLSSSVFGIIFGVIIFFTLRGTKARVKLFFGVAATWFVLPYLYYRFIHKIQFGNDSGLGIRESVFKNSIDYITSSVDGLLFGVKNLLSLQQHTPFVMSDNDIGLVFYLFISTGGIFSVFLLLLLFMMIRSVRYESKIAFIVLMLSKHSIFTVFFPFMLFMILSNKNCIKRRRVNNSGSCISNDRISSKK